MVVSNLRCQRQQLWKTTTRNAWLSRLSRGRHPAASLCRKCGPPAMGPHGRWQHTELNLLVADILLAQPTPQQLLWVLVEHDHLQDP